MASPAFPARYSLKSNNNMPQHCGVLVGLIVSGVLDEGKLENAHRELVERWPAVGGTLIKDTTPFSFSSGSTVNFGSRSLPQKLENLQALTHFSQTSFSHPTYHDMHATESDRLFHYDTINSLLPPDTLFALRVTTLEDATLLGFRFSHHLFDGQACYDTIKAYCNLVSGNAIPELIPPLDISTCLSELVHGEDSLPPNVRKDHPHLHPSVNFSLGFVAVAKYVGTSLFAKLMAKVGLAEGDDERMVHVPGGFVEELRNQCQDELNEAARRGELEEGAGLELSRNDVLTAWFLKSSYASSVPSETQGIDLYFSVNYRSFLGPLPPNQLYLHNSFCNIRTNFPSVSNFQQSSLSRIALAIRLTCVRNKQPSAIRSALQFWERPEAGANIIQTPPDLPFVLGYVPIVTHWTTFEYCKLNFGGAMKSGSGSGKVIYTSGKKG
ncbi:hypothetical protein BDQ17DRAFT_1433417 [Cyathus striatus]|nr:hypothetical protein BDQ17DRAFT_1433417 [Cyathus striatus]